MSRKKNLIKKLTSIVLTLTLTMVGMLVSPTTAHAAGWPDYALPLTLGSTVHGTIKDGDYWNKLENNFSGDQLYCWHVYRFSMSKSGLLNIYLESGNQYYFYSDAYYPDRGSCNGFAIFSASNPDDLIWRSSRSGNQINYMYSTAREVYCGSTEISLEQGDYYFTIRQRYTSNIPYYLTLSYKEPAVNVASISLDKKNLQLEPGEQATLTADVLPDNATDKTVVWESSDPSVASVENGTVTAKAAGMTTVTASSSDGEITASCQVTVIDTGLIDSFEESKPTINDIEPGRKKATVYFSSVDSYGVKYQVAYRTGSGKWKTKNTAITTATIRNLKSKKIYSIRVRGYNQFYGKTYYSSWSGIKKVKVK